MSLALCARHLADLRSELQRRDLWRFTATDARILAQRGEDWLAGRTPRESLDPMVVATFAIYGKAASYGVRSGCPVCGSARVLRRPDVDAEWIGRCVEVVHELFAFNGLVREGQ
jgi:hypothetical protein